MVSGRWHLLRSGPGAPAENMATDEALLSWAARRGGPVLRLYGWDRPAASFGYFQRYRQVAQWTGLRPLVRRPTGGGLVPHDADWTYSLALPAGHAWHALRARESYRRVHAWVREALEHCGFDAALAPEVRSGVPEQCFANAETDDVVFEGRKVAGAAQRRTREGLLIQGSIQPPPGAGWNRERWERAFLDVAAGEWGAAGTPMEADEAIRADVARLVAERYGRRSFMERR